MAARGIASFRGDGDAFSACPPIAGSCQFLPVVAVRLFNVFANCIIRVLIAKSAHGWRYSSIEMILDNQAIVLSNGPEVHKNVVCEFGRASAVISATMAR
jgi:hypothetical protein